MAGKVMFVRAPGARYSTGRPCKRGHTAERLGDGHCSECIREKRKSPAQKERGRKRYREKYAQNPKYFLERNRKWRARNPEKSREIERACTRRRRIEKPEEVRAEQERWRKANLPKMAAKQARRRQRIAATQLSAEDKRLIEQIYAETRFMSEISGVEFQVDHIIPLSKGGQHHWKNLQAIPAKDNQSKGNRQAEIGGKLSAPGGVTVYYGKVVV